jgi:putative endonuclease
MLVLRLVEEFVHVSEALAVRLKRGPRRAAHLNLGVRGEEAAFFYLRRCGYVVVARGWRSAKVPGGEVATAESAVDEDKVRVLRRVARQYMQALPVAPDQVRFDVLSIYYQDQQDAEMELYRGAFGWR